MSLRIHNLQAENYKRLVAVDISPSGDIVTIAGKNAQGKSSVLDSIYAALAGGDGKVDKPIREGQDAATVRLDLGDLVVIRKWRKNDGGTLTVEAKDGARYSSPQTVLDDLVGRFAFDPLAFIHQKPKDQVATLLTTVDLPFDPDELERQRRGAYDARTEAGREVKRLEGQLSGYPETDPALPEQETAASTIIEQIEQARQQNTLAEQQGFRLRARANLVDEAEATLARARDALASARSALDEAKAEIPFAPVEIAPLTAKLSTIEDENARIRKQAERARVDVELSEARATHEKHASRIATIEKQKADALAGVNFPIDGLSFDDDGVTLNGIPLSQASSAEQLRVSVALAMAANPSLRVLRILDGSLLDSDSMKIIADLAAERDYQVWVEVVDESGKIGVVIEDGQVKP